MESEIKKVRDNLENYLNARFKLEDYTIVILDEATMVRDTYYVFFYQSKAYLENSDFSYALAGNAPIIVDKVTGEYFVTGTANPVEEYLEEYEQGIKIKLVK